MANTLVIQLDDADYNTLKRAADRDGTELEAWLVRTAKLALTTGLPNTAEQRAPGADVWPSGFFEATYGSLAEDPLERLPPSAPDTREPIR